MLIMAAAKSKSSARRLNMFRRSGRSVEFIVVVLKHFDNPQ
jgi:hypothetical protein